jgi:hypothetical protein
MFRKILGCLKFQETIASSFCALGRTKQKAYQIRDCKEGTNKKITRPGDFEGIQTIKNPGRPKPTGVQV